MDSRLDRENLEPKNMELPVEQAKQSIPEEENWRRVCGQDPGTTTVVQLREEAREVLLLHTINSVSCRLSTLLPCSKIVIQWALEPFTTPCFSPQ